MTKRPGKLHSKSFAGWVNDAPLPQVSLAAALTLTLITPSFDPEAVTLGLTPVLAVGACPYGVWISVYGPRSIVDARDRKLPVRENTR